MARAQCIVCRGLYVLMVKHSDGRDEWWCLPGGGIEEGETPAEAAIRELEEECCVIGTVIRETSTITYGPSDKHYTYLVDIGEQEPALGSDPELTSGKQILADARWLALDEIPERDRCFVWAEGLITVDRFMAHVETWGNEVSYPVAKTQSHVSQNRPNKPCKASM